MRLLMLLNLTPVECIKRINASADIYRFSQANRHPKEKRLSGNIFGKRFLIEKNYYSKWFAYDGFKPILNGRFEEAENGTKLVGRFTIFPPILIFYVLFLGAVGFAAFKYPSIETYVLVVLTLGMYVLGKADGRQEEKEICEELKTIFQDCLVKMEMNKGVLTRNLPSLRRTVIKIPQGRGRKD